ncbi:MAG: hypothetical protein GF401_15760 [Chitinivibrionales bacterium]|nr:hypothetical protein [Chitinivibrionales bacterium]
MVGVHSLMPKKSSVFSFLFVFLLFGMVNAQAPYRVDAAYEDSVRIVIVYNTPSGKCGALPAVGIQTRDSVIHALDTSRVPNVRLFTFGTIDISGMQSLWPGRLPHVIVHINAGWGEGGARVPTEILNWAASNYIGIVSIGDDAADLATEIFGFNKVDNTPAPLEDGMWLDQLNDSLFIQMHPSNDTLLITRPYPYLNGIINNAVDSVMNGDSTIYFKPVVDGGPDGRCQADADAYTIEPGFEDKLTFLGYQRGYNSTFETDDYTTAGYVGAPTQWGVVVALQDSILSGTQQVVRRGVALSYQPQFLQNTTASEQVVYDAIMYASLAHTLRPAQEVRLRINGNDTISAGDSLEIIAEVISASGQVDPTYSELVRWSLDGSLHRPGDTLSNDSGSATKFTGTFAYREARVIATFIDPNFGTELTASLRIWIDHGLPHHLVIEDSNGGANSPNNDAPIGGNSRLTLSSTEVSTENVYAILRDVYGNYVDPSSQTTWDTLAGPQLIVSATNGTNSSQGQGRITKTFAQDSGSTRVYAWCRISAYQNNPLFRDTILVRIDPTAYDLLRIVDVNGSPLSSFTTTIDDSTLLFVEGRRVDNGDWVSVSGAWSMNPTLSPRIPPSSGPSWNFSAQDTGTATIMVTRQTLSASVTVTVGPGAPARLVLYDTIGTPDINGNDPLPKFTNARAGTAVFMTAKLYDSRNNWLRDYEINTTLGNQIEWPEAQLDAGILLNGLRGHSNRYYPRTAGLVDTVIARVANTTIADTLIVTVFPGAPAFLEIVYDTTGLSRVPAKLDFSQNDTVVTFYTILRDSLMNFAGFAFNTSWASRETLIVTAERGANTAYGEGIVRRVTDDESFVFVVAEYFSTETSEWLRDSMNIHLTYITYDSLRVYAFNNGYQPIDSLSLRTGESRTLFGYGKHPVRGWEQIPVTWNKSAGLGTVGNPPNWSNQWNVGAAGVGTGWIKITRSGSVPDSIPVTFLPSDPNRIDIYDRAGDPSGVTAIGNLTITAGNRQDLYAKVFYGSEWFSQYENIDSSRSIISWGIRQVDGTAPAETLSTLNGHVTSFTPVSAWTSYTIVAVFEKGGIRLVDSIAVTVTPDTADHIVIERLRIAPNNGNQPYDPVIFDEGTGVIYPYAILRDRFGNYVENCGNAEWRSLDETVVTAQDGRIPQDGEGRIDREGTTGDTTQVVAWNADSPSDMSMYDTVRVILSNAVYDSLRIVATPEGMVRLDSLAIVAGKDTTLYVQGLRRFDTSWVVIEANWSFTSSTLDPVNDYGDNFTFTTPDPGTGTITVSRGTAVPDTLSVTVSPGAPNRLVLYPAEGEPNVNGNNPYDAGETVTAGNPFPLVGKLFFNDIWLDSYESDPQLSIEWLAVDSQGHTDSLSGTLQPSTVLPAKATYTPTMAYRTVYVTAKWNDLKDTVALSIVPGTASQLVLEPDDRPALNQAEGVDTVKITNVSFSGEAYAVLRDDYGNFVDYSKATTWEELLPDIVDVSTGNASVGQGIVVKDTAATDSLTRIYAIDDTTGLADTAYVKLLKYFYTDLRIRVVSPSSAFDSITNTLSINTNEDAVLVVEGLRSDAPIWEDVSATWSAPSLDVDPSPPASAESWTFSPADTGTGVITVTYPGANPDSLNVVFTPGPPTSIGVRIITPEDKLIAGQEITAVVTIRNEDGRVPGDSICYATVYQDTLGDGGRDSLPVVIIGDSTYPLNQRPNADINGTQCFSGGVDTVRFVLYYAPWDKDSTHQMFVQLGNLEGITEPFTLLPARLDSLDLVPSRGTRDSVVLDYSHDETVIITSMGYDQFGNLIGEIPTNWDATGNLHDITGQMPSSRVLYSASNVTHNESGYIVSRSPEDTLITDSVFVEILRLAGMTAVTADTNGNGFLDRITLNFDLPVDLTDTAFAEFFSVVRSYGDYTDTLPVAGIMQPDSTDSTVFVLVLHEDTARSEGPQTNWTPVVYVDNNDAGATGIRAADTVKAADGAGPVVWEVTKMVENVDDRTSDLVKVIFSESILDSSTGSFSITSATPSSLFDVWAPRAGGGGEVLVPGLFDGIQRFHDVDKQGKWVEFYMTNDSILTSHHKLSFNVEQIVDTSTGDRVFASELIDRNNNMPLPENVPVQVSVKGALPNKIVVGPNPFPPSAKHKEEELTHRLPEQAMKWALEEGGTVLTAKMIISSETEKVVGSLKIYDIAGNLVYHRDSHDNLLPTDWMVNTDGAIRQFNFYWNGLNDRGMKVSPGVYRALLYLEEHRTSETRKKTYTSSLGVGR